MAWESQPWGEQPWSTKWDSWSRHSQPSSSHGKKSQDDSQLNLPANFKSNEFFLDTEKQPSVNGFPLHRYVESTPWSRKQNLNGREVSSLKVWELAYRGWQEQSLRHLSAGRFTSVVFCRSIAESVLMSRLLSTLRSQSVDIDQVAQAMFEEAFPEKALPDKRDQASDFIKPMIDQILQLFDKYKTTSQEHSAMKEVEALRKRIQELEQHSKPQKLSEGQGTNSSGQKRPSEYQTPPRPKVRKLTQDTPSRQTTLSFAESSSPPEPPSKKPPEAISVAEEDQSEEEGAPHASQNPASVPADAAWHPTSPVLQQYPIQSTQKKQLDQWIENITAALPVAKQPHLAEHIALVESLFESMADDLKPDLQDLANRWGLPLRLASKCSAQGALKVVAVASFLAA